MKRLVLVTGAAGEVGRRLVRRLVADGWRVRALVLPADPLRSRLDGTADARSSRATFANSRA